MVRMLCVALLASSVSTAALAATYEPDSAVDAVTVYPSGAQVTRLSKVDIEAGEHIIIIDDLPAGIDPASVRVSGEGSAPLGILGVDVRTSIIESGGSSEQRIALEARRDELQDLQASLQQQRADINVRRELLQALVRNAATGGDEPALMSAVSLNETLSVVAEQLADLNAQTIATRAQERETQKEIARVQSQLSLLAPRQEQRMLVEVSVSAEQAASATLNVKYNVREAGWRAVYDASLSLEDGVEDVNLDLKRRALVEQSTRESWDNVALTLSTARPTAATQAPQLQANVIDQVPDRPMAIQQQGNGNQRAFSPASKSGGGMLGLQNMVTADTEVVAVAQERSAEMNTGGFNATFNIAGRVSVSNAREAKSVLLGSDTVAVEVSALSVPRIDPTAYLVAEFTLSGEATYLPGEVLLTRDGTYIGRGSMPLLAPGDTHQLGFGNDDFITVERVDKDRTQGETGILVSSNTETREAVITVTNNHTFDMPVRIIDRVPVSDHEDIEVEALAGNTSPSETNVDGKRGVVAFDLNVAAGGDAQIDLGYRVMWPTEMKITQVQ
ncbi:MAG: mucoidy inhibitor MuiA family protein [Pseudomonadota bacterium]